MPDPTTFQAPIEGGFVSGDENDNVILGSDHDDMMSGDEGSDLLSGGGGVDDLSGGTGNDTLDGGAGDDMLRGDAGDDLLTGGDGMDRFEFHMEDTGTGLEGFGHDTISDFGEGDQIDITGWGTGDLGVTASYDGTNTLLTFGAGQPWESTLLIENYIVPEWELPQPGMGGEMFSLWGNADDRIL